MTQALRYTSGYDGSETEKNKKARFIASANRTTAKHPLIWIFIHLLCSVSPSCCLHPPGWAAESAWGYTHTICSQRLLIVYDYKHKVDAVCRVQRQTQRFFFFLCHRWKFIATEKTPPKTNCNWQLHLGTSEAKAIGFISRKSSTPGSFKQNRLIWHIGCDVMWFYSVRGKK